MKNYSKDAFFSFSPLIIIFILQTLLFTCLIITGSQQRTSIDSLQAHRISFIAKVSQDSNFEISLSLKYSTKKGDISRVKLKSIIAAFVPNKREHYGFLTSYNLNFKSKKQIYVLI